MKPTTCKLEPAVRDAALRDRWTAVLREHAAACDTCQESLDVLEAMRAISLRSAATLPEPPSHYAVWLRAEYAHAQRRRSRRRVLEALATVGVAGLGVVVFLLWPPRGEMAALAPVTNALEAFAGGIPAAATLGLVMLALLWFMDLRWTR
jgi:hypothetical protein